MSADLDKLKEEREARSKRLEIAPAELSQKLRDAQSSLVSVSQTLGGPRRPRIHAPGRGEPGERRRRRWRTRSYSSGRGWAIWTPGRTAAEKESKLRVELAALKKIEDPWVGRSGPAGREGEARQKGRPRPTGRRS